MEPIELKTPSGYKVYLKPELTYGQYVTFQKIIASDMTVNPTTGASQDIKGSAVFEATDKVLEFLLVKILSSKGEELPAVAQTINDMPAKDGILVFKKINEITAEAGGEPESKKK